MFTFYGVTHVVVNLSFNITVTIINQDIYICTI